jgi:hypothetical protein
VLLTSRVVSLRDSKNPDEPRFDVAPRAWRAFLGEVSNR